LDVGQYRSVESASCLAENGPGSLRTLFAFAIITLITSAFVPSGIPSGESNSVDGESRGHDDLVLFIAIFTKNRLAKRVHANDEVVDKLTAVLSVPVKAQLAGVTEFG